MKTANVVIGANFGDEGKGLTTDFFCEEAGGAAVVVRFNGGAQAGHTVVTPDNTRHVFSHFGSGSFTGAETFLSRYFVCNPLLFAKEHAVLAPKCAIPPMHADAAAPVTTPYDMMINQMAEEARGASRHGSCGMGFGETLERHENGFKITCGDLADTESLRQKLKNLRENWMPQRLFKLGLSNVPEKWQERIASDGILDKYVEDTALFLQLVTVEQPDYLGKVEKRIVFEGAQGLLLAEDHRWFPHVTRSPTGLKNVLLLAGDAGIGQLDVAYITRAYLTRHGAGPMPHELGRLPYPRITDATNVHNDWQGSLRFGWLELDLLATTIKDDLARNQSSIKVSHGIAVTCLDQLDGEATVAEGDKLSKVSVEMLPALIKLRTGASFLIESRGPSRTNVNRV
ncbi:MAG: adenylosuccinate synthetase [Alphaproteobacteria bacterium]